jgi:hypothetical protein
MPCKMYLNVSEERNNKKINWSKFVDAPKPCPSNKKHNVGGPTHNFYFGPLVPGHAIADTGMVCGSTGGLCLQKRRVTCRVEVNRLIDGGKGFIFLLLQLL